MTNPYTSTPCPAFCYSRDDLKARSLRYEFLFATQLVKDAFGAGPPYIAKAVYSEISSAFSSISTRSCGPGQLVAPSARCEYPRVVRSARISRAEPRATGPHPSHCKPDDHPMGIAISLPLDACIKFIQLTTTIYRVPVPIHHWSHHPLPHAGPRYMPLAILVNAYREGHQGRCSQQNSSADHDRAA